MVASRLTITSIIFATAMSSLQNIAAQDSTFTKALSYSLFADVYYSYDFNRPAANLKPGFLFNHNRHNEVTVNLALIKINYRGNSVRAAVGLMAGTYVEYNLAAEPEALRHLYEATVGVKISRNNSCWIDAGIFPSHIGFETAISKDNATLTRSMAAENSPYYETGLKISYTGKENKWFVSGLLLNGWQRIRRPEGNSSLCIGTQLTYTPDPKTMLNWSTFIGNDKPDSAYQFRFFNNFYGIITLSEKWKLTAGFDIGLQKQQQSLTYDTWLSPVAILQYQPQDKWSFAVRGEYFNDPKEVIIKNPVSASSFRTFGLSINADKKIGDHCWWRTECRLLKSKEAIFQIGNSNSHENICLSTSFALAL